MAVGQTNQLKTTKLEKANGENTSIEKAKAKAKANMEKAVAIVKSGQGRAMVMVKDPKFQTITITTATGAICLGTVGGAFGTASGIVIGTAGGAVPALFTFGLSLPIGAVMGGGSGLCVGAAAGAGVGGFTGGLAGFGGYKYRCEIKNGLITIKRKAVTAQGQTKAAAGKAADKTKARLVVFVDGVKQKSIEGCKFTKARAGEFAAQTMTVVKTDKFKVTAASASAGAVVGGGTGAVVGGTAGAALGLIPALFTFGLSIPFGAVVGGCVGATAGTVTGAVGAGTVGYGGFAYRNEIRSNADVLVKKAKENTQYAKTKIQGGVAKFGKTKVA